MNLIKINQNELIKISKNQFLFNKRKSVGINHFNDPKAFTEYSNDMHDAYKILMITILIKKIRY